MACVTKQRDPSRQELNRAGFFGWGSGLTSIILYFCVEAPLCEVKLSLLIFQYNITLFYLHYFIRVKFLFNKNERYNHAIY